MARPSKEALEPKDVRGLKYLRAFWDVLEPLQDIPVHGNRTFFMHQYVALLLLHFFNPVLNSLRALQEATGLDDVQKVVGVKRTSLGAMSDSAGHVFDPELMVPILESVIERLPDLPQDGRVPWDLLPGRVRAMDGSFLRCLPKMTWAVFRTQSDRRGVKLHLQFDVQTGAPASADLTAALGSEKKALRKRLKPGMLYLVDRGYIQYRLYQAIHDVRSFFVARLNANSSYTVRVDRPLTPGDGEAGVIADQEVQMGSAFTEGHLTAPVRRIVIRNAEGKEVVLLTNTDLPAEIVALLYRYRWQVELFFRWFKCILGCTHWVSQSPTGLTLQVYVALLASLLVSLLTGRKPSRRTYRMLCLYFQGWANAEELAAHLASLKTRG